MFQPPMLQPQFFLAPWLSLAQAATEMTLNFQRQALRAWTAWLPAAPAPASAAAEPAPAPAPAEVPTVELAPMAEAIPLTAAPVEPEPAVEAPRRKAKTAQQLRASIPRRRAAAPKTAGRGKTRH